MKIIIQNGDISHAEQDEYVGLILKKYPGLEIDHIVLELSEDQIIYRIAVNEHILTKMGGSVIGDPQNWNTAKQSEYYETIPNRLE